MHNIRLRVTNRWCLPLWITERHISWGTKKNKWKISDIILKNFDKICDGNNFSITFLFVIISSWLASLLLSVRRSIAVYKKTSSYKISFYLFRSLEEIKKRKHIHFTQYSIKNLFHSPDPYWFINMILVSNNRYY